MPIFWKRSRPFVVLLSLAISLDQAKRVAAADSQPNIVFVLTDDQRYDTLGITGNEFVETPNLDQLARDGVIFDRATVTSAICTPSRACYFLGQYERRHGVNFNSGTALSEQAWQNSYPLVLRRGGYCTGYVGKNHLPIGRQGYESGVLEKSFDYWYAAHGHLTFYPKDKHPIFERAKADTQIEIVQQAALSFLKGKNNSESDYLTGAKAFIAKCDREKPFCLSIALNLPHGASTSTMELRPSDDALYRTAYRDRISELPISPHYLAKADIQTPKLPAEISRPQFRQDIYDYVDQPDTLRERMVRQYQTITGIDRLVGQLRKTLADSGLAENTVIIFTSDHGLMLGEFGLGGKALNYEPCLRVPMIVCDPRQPESQRGKRLNQLVQSIDIAPTIIDLAALPCPASMQGESLMPLVAGETTDWRTEAFAENLWSTIFGNPRCESVTTDRWKYIRYFANDRTIYQGISPKEVYRVNPRQTAAYAHWLTSSIRGEQPDYEELFDLANDPDETTNLASEAAFADELERMRTRCQQLVHEAKGDANLPPDTVPLP